MLSFLCGCSEAREKEEEEMTRLKNPTIREQFADAKRELSTLSDADWESIPEPVWF
jgi:pre-mRNA-processing factor 6